MNGAFGSFVVSRVFVHTNPKRKRGILPNSLGEAIKSPLGRVFLLEMRTEGAMQPLGQRLTAGEPAAFAELYDLCAVRCHHYLVVRLGSRDAADEVLQEAFVRLVRQRVRLERVDNLVAYVFTVARNEAVRYAERRRREERPFLAAEDLFLEARSDDRAQREAAETAAVALGQLPAEGREIVELKIYGGLTFREIADLLALPQGTVATRYRTALGRLKDWFARQPS